MGVNMKSFYLQVETTLSFSNQIVINIDLNYLELLFETMYYI